MPWSKLARSFTAKSTMSRPSRTQSRGTRPASAAAVVLVLAGHERFVRGLGASSVARVVVERFPNGELHVHVPEGVDGRRCVLVGSISPPAGNLER